MLINPLDLLIMEVTILYFLSRKITTTAASSLNMYLLALIFLPGTIIHELSHFLMAKILFVKASLPNFIPQKSPEGIKLGSITVAQTDLIRRTLIGIAPLLFGVSAILFLVSKINYANPSLSLVLSVLIVFEIGNTMFASPQDLQGIKVVIVPLILFYITSKFLGVNIKLPPITKDLILYFGAPITIDLVILTLLNVIKPKLHP